MNAPTKFIKILIILFLFNQTLIGQNRCKDFKNYEESQEWIKNTSQLSFEDRKTKIFTRIKCEQESEQGEIDYRLLIVVDGVPFSTPSEISNKQIVSLNLIPAENFDIKSSLCESDIIYPQKCNLGSVIIYRPKNPVLNEITILKDIEVKRKKEKIIIKLKSEVEDDIKFEINSLFERNSTNFFTNAKLKKGKNRFVFKNYNILQLIELGINEKKLIIII